VCIVCPGKASGKLRDQDVLDELLSCRAHDTLMLLSSTGRAYAIKAHKVPEVSRAAMGTPIAQVRRLSPSSAVARSFPVPVYAGLPFDLDALHDRTHLPTHMTKQQKPGSLVLAAHATELMHDPVCMFGCCRCWACLRLSTSPRC
jgi:DNA gyrase/topoisomerase IV subunit A